MSKKEVTLHGRYRDLVIKVIRGRRGERTNVNFYNLNNTPSFQIDRSNHVQIAEQLYRLADYLVYTSTDNPPDLTPESAALLIKETITNTGMGAKKIRDNMRLVAMNADRAVIKDEKSELSYGERN